jgi:hypothetical protein
MSYLILIYSTDILLFRSTRRISGFVSAQEIQMPKKRKRVVWSAEHLRTLKAMAKKKKPAAAIAKSLKRTEGATRQKAFSMGLSLDTRA